MLASERAGGGKEEHPLGEGGQLEATDVRGRASPEPQLPGGASGHEASAAAGPGPCGS